MDSVLAATRPLGPVATAVVAGILVTAGVAVVVGHLVIRIRWRLDARREERGHGDEQRSETGLPGER